jgi:hypothetical protein
MPNRLRKCKLWQEDARCFASERLRTLIRLDHSRARAGRSFRHEATRWERIRRAEDFITIELRMKELLTDETRDIRLYDCKISSGVRIAAGTYEVSLHDLNGGPIWKNFRYFQLAGDKPVDLTRAVSLPWNEVEALINPEPVEEEIAPPEFKRISRSEDANASRLGWTLGRLEDSDIRLGGQRTFHLFHLPHALLIGCVEAPVELRGDWSVMEFAIYDAVGQPVIRTNLKFQKHGLVRSEFDHILVQPGDYTAVWKSPGTCIGQGSSYNPYVGILDNAAEYEPPILDELMRSLHYEGLQKIGMPLFHLKSDK